MLISTPPYHNDSSQSHARLLNKQNNININDNIYMPPPPRREGPKGERVIWSCSKLDAIASKKDILQSQNSTTENPLIVPE